jgi:YidC/Oxa1 family membrane protein insertase
MILAIVWFQGLLYGLGSALAFLYRLIPNYGVAIILLTLGIRVLLLPLGLKQIRSMQAMQAIQPKVKALQQKYKGNRQKLNEETMALYKEHGVNPLSGCLPLLLQFPVLIALYAVLRVPGGLAHIPPESRLSHDIRTQASGVQFLGANLLCSAGQAGSTGKPLAYPKGTPVKDQIEDDRLHCGKGVPVRIPYYVFMLAMVATTYYQQRQMQRASPPGGNQQQQAIAKIMPLLFLFWGFLFPSGLVVYWTTTNLVQIGQQHFMLPKKVEGAAEPPKGTTGGGRRPGPDTGRARGSGTGGRPRGQAQRRDGQGQVRKPRLGQQSQRPRGEGQGPKTGGAGSAGRAGGRDGGDRKKRRKR